MTLQQAVRSGELRDCSRHYTALVDDATSPTPSADLMDFRYRLHPHPPGRGGAAWSPSSRRFKTGAMSYGSISQEAHECLAHGHERHLGGKSNSGEGGEDPARLRHPTATPPSSRWPPAASASPARYLVSAKEIQIKMAQGAKPGEGGHLPGREGLPLDRQDPLFHPRRHPHLPAAPPRHLLHRGPGRS